MPFIIDFVNKENEKKVFRLRGMEQKMKNRLSLDNYFCKAKDFQKYEKNNKVVTQYISKEKEILADFGKTVLYNQKFNLSEEEWRTAILDNFGQNNFCMNLIKNGFSQY